VHELSISSAIVDAALRYAGGRKVTAVELRIGALRQVVPESLEFYFEIVSRDTLCDAAELRFELIEAWMGCGTCGHEWDPAPEPLANHEALTPVVPAFRCPACERADADVIRGGELEVESIDVVEEEEECIAPR
jgi:hydrogenase nickel incorporation protein HypA/HybF